MCSQLLFSLLLGCVFLQPTRDYFAFFSLSDNETGVKTKIILALKTPAGYILLTIELTIQEIIRSRCSIPLTGVL